MTLPQLETGKLRALFAVAPSRLPPGSDPPALAPDQVASQVSSDHARLGAQVRELGLQAG